MLKDLRRVEVCYTSSQRGAKLQMKSPTGTIKTAYLRGRWWKLSDELSSIATRLSRAMPEEYRQGKWQTEMVTVEAMQEMLRLDQECRAQWLAYGRQGRR